MFISFLKCYNYALFIILFILSPSAPPYLSKIDKVLFKNCSLEDSSSHYSFSISSVSQKVFNGISKIGPSSVVAQDWWQSGSMLGQWASWYYTPLPGQFFTHLSDDSNYAWLPNEIVVTIAKPGFGVFRGFSKWVYYDYMWTESPPAPGRHVNCFLGIPYAAPPTGQLRFQPPRPVFLDTRAPWAAKKYRSACLQPPEYVRKWIPNFSDFSEDCLYLNIIYPNNTWDPPMKRYPVIVHLHGGHFMYGASQLYPSHALASTGVLVVTLNYRLGAFGFLTTQGFASLGNWGLWDQVEALKWVRDNIEWFRGDKTSVTIMGDDAGAASVGLHMISPMSRSRGLYHKAIMMSGSDLAAWAVTDSSRVYPKDYATSLAKSLGCPINDEFVMIHCMRYYKSASEILSASEKIASKMPYLPTWGPVVDGAMGFVPHLPQADRASGFFAPVPLMAGVVRDEGAHESQRYVPNIDSSPDFSESQWADGVWNFIKEQKVIWIREKDVFDELQYRYTWWGEPRNASARRQSFMDLFGDFFYASGVDGVAKYQSYQQPHTYFYVFNYRSRLETTPTWLGVPHGADIPYVWGFPFMNSSWFQDVNGMKPIRDRWDIMDGNTSEFMMVMVSNFAKYTNPTPWLIRNCTWYPFQPPDDFYMMVMDNCSIRQRYHEGNLAFWRERWPLVGDLQPIVPTFIPFPIYDYQIATWVLAPLCVIALLVIGVLVFLILMFRRRVIEEIDRGGPVVTHEMYTVQHSGLARIEGFSEGVSTRALTNQPFGAPGFPGGSMAPSGFASAISAGPPYKFGATALDTKRSLDKENPFDTGKLMSIDQPPPMPDSYRFGYAPPQASGWNQSPPPPPESDFGAAAPRYKRSNELLSPESPPVGSSFGSREVEPLLLPSEKPLPFDDSARALPATAFQTRALLKASEADAPVPPPKSKRPPAPPAGPPLPPKGEGALARSGRSGSQPLLEQDEGNRGPSSSTRPKKPHVSEF